MEKSRQKEKKKRKERMTRKQLRKKDTLTHQQQQFQMKKFCREERAL